MLMAKRTQSHAISHLKVSIRGGVIIKGKFFIISFSESFSKAPKYSGNKATCQGWWLGRWDICHQWDMICEERQEEFIIFSIVRTTRQKKDAQHRHLLHPDLPLCRSWRFRMNEKAMLGKWKNNMSSGHLLNI